VPDYGLGRLPAIDERDNAYRLESVMLFGTPLPSYYYYTTGAVLDQGAQPHCVGYAWRQWLTSGLAINRGGPDASGIYHAAQRVDEWPGEGYDGTSVRAGAKVLAAQGYVSEYRWTLSATVLSTWLLSKRGPVVLGTAWTNDMFYPDRNGFVEPTGPAAGGHAYLCIGYSDTRGAFRCVNSWSRHWGQNGRFWILGEDVQRLFDDDGECCTAIEARR
jgi:hypothetical protein